jgi:hypothetical protein
MPSPFGILNRYRGDTLQWKSGPRAWGHVVSDADNLICAGGLYRRGTWSTSLPVGNDAEAFMMRQAKDGPADRRIRETRRMQGPNDWSFHNLIRATLSCAPTIAEL